MFLEPEGIDATTEVQPRVQVRGALPPPTTSILMPFELTRFTVAPVTLFDKLAKRLTAGKGDLVNGPTVIAAKR